MGDPLWVSMEGKNIVQRKDLELVIATKKLDDVFKWFNDHFIKDTDMQYRARCPIVIFQGPTGCGKTSILKWISHELKARIKEYSETTDTVSLNYELGSMNNDERGANLSQIIDRRKAMKFEHFIIYSIRYNTLYGTEKKEKLPESENKNDESKHPLVKEGIIIHIDTPLMFARSQRILIQTLHKLLKVMKEISPQLMRRVAIVFETLEGDGDIIPIPTKVKESLGITVFKFNPIIKTNMKKLVESLVKDLKNIELDKNTMEQLIYDSDGDMRACINTLQLICNKSPGQNVFKQINQNSLNGNDIKPNNLPLNKKQKLMPEKVRNVVWSTSLMRDSNTRSVNFFHVLGKIFYQKRIYPNSESQLSIKRYRSIDRPYPTENNTEHLADLVDTEPKNLIVWLHQHYHKFCRDTNIEKAALFLENLSETDTISVSSAKSAQFYEMHNALDQLQTHLCIESTVYSLYQDQSSVTKTSRNKKTSTNSEDKIIKSSVETSGDTNKGELFSFKKPISMNLNNLIDDYQKLLNHCRVRLYELSSRSNDPQKVLLDYIPYMKYISSNWTKMSLRTQAVFNSDFGSRLIYGDEKTQKLFNALEMELEVAKDLELEARHEKLMELLEDVQTIDSKNLNNQTNMLDFGFNDMSASS